MDGAEPVERALQQALGRFLRAKEAEGISPHTTLVLRRSLKNLFDFLTALPDVASVAGISREDLTLYRDHILTRQKRPTCPQGSASGLLSASTLRQHLWATKTFFRFLEESEEIPFDPARVLRLPRLPRRLPRDVPSVGQMRRLIHVAASTNRHPLALRDVAILELLYVTGLRNAELCALLREDFDENARVVFVKKGKGGKDRLLPVGEKAYEALERHLAKTPTDAGKPLFATRFGTAMRPDYVRGLVKRAAKRCGLPKRISPHSLRHACATHLLKGHADIRRIQVLLGHASLSTTEIYTHVDTSDLKKVLKRCHPRETNP